MHDVRYSIIVDIVNVAHEAAYSSAPWTSKAYQVNTTPLVMLDSRYLNNQPPLTNKSISHMTTNPYKFHD
jgi:hypothetical protein